MRALLVSMDSSVADTISCYGAACSIPIEVTTHRAGLSEVIPVLSGADMDLLIVDAVALGENDVELLERVLTHHPAERVLLLVGHDQTKHLVMAMRLGMSELLILPLDARLLSSTLERLVHKCKKQAPANGVVVAFAACKGGSGATFIAANVGYALAAVEQHRVVLIDLQSHLSDAASYVCDSSPPLTLPEFCSQLGRADAAFLDSALARVCPNFGILTGGDDSDRSAEITPARIDMLLDLAKRNYDFVLLDLGRTVDAVSLRALDQAAVVFPILQTTVPDVRDASRFVATLRSLGYPDEKIRPIVNRYDTSSRVQLRDVVRAVGCAVVHTVPNDFATVSSSINQGEPLLRVAASSPVARALGDLASVLAGTPAPVRSPFVPRWIASFARWASGAGKTFQSGTRAP